MYKREWKEEDLIRCVGGVVCKDTGRWSVCGCAYEVNYSDILTRLIQEAGRWCERFASDLFIDWNIIEKNRHDLDWQGGNYFFGFRKNGVDGLSFILNRLSENPETYRSIWMIKVEIEDMYITMELYKLNI